MKGVLSILKNNFYRSANKKNYIIVTLIITFLSIMLAVYFTSKLEIKGNIAVVSSSPDVNIGSGFLKVTVLDKIPPRSELVMNKYDAVVIDRGGRYEIDTIKSDSFKNKLENVINHADASGFEGEAKRGPGANVLGYLTMFVLLQGLMFMTLYSDDKENKTFKRIGVSPVPIGCYLLAHGIFNFLFVYIPTFAVLVVCKEALKVNIGLGYVHYLLLLGILSMLSTAFALFMSSVMENADNCMTLGSTVVTLTSILAGSFYSFNSGNAMVKNLIGVLPQKSYLNLVQGIEQGKALGAFLPQLGYMLALSILLFALGAVICKRKFNQGIC